MAELADARDLKSREIYFSYRFDPGFRHHSIAEWSSLVARRAHNPKVMRFKSHLRNQKNSNHHTVVWVFSFLVAEIDGILNLMTCALWASPFGIRANNLRPKLKQLSVVLTTVDTTKQGVSRTKCIEVIADDYATCADGHDTATPWFKYISALIS